MIAELKTKPNDQSVDAFLDSISDEKRRRDCRVILEMMREATGSAPQMWGDSIVGFGMFHYVHDTGTEGDWFLTGFSPRKQNLTLYIMTGFDEYVALLETLGKHKTGKSCLYIKSLEDVDQSVLKELITKSVTRP